MHIFIIQTCGEYFIYSLNNLYYLILILIKKQKKHTHVSIFPSHKLVMIILFDF